MAGTQRPSRSFTWFLWLVSVTAGSMLSGPLSARDFAASVVKVRAVAADGAESFGSGVVIAIDLLATACHVTRDAKTIEIAHGAERWVGTVASGSPAHDLCLIHVPQLNLPAVAIRASASLQLGDRVSAAGFPNGDDLVVRDGAVEGLYTYEGGKVIRTSAVFDYGSSGGGLFDAEGALVGVLAFKARYGARLHFALPADWTTPGNPVFSRLVPFASSNERVAFWEQPKAAQPSFLRHALLEATSQR